MGERQWVRQALWGIERDRQFRSQVIFGIGLEYVHNLNVMARVLLNWDLRFRLMCDFKELRVAKTAHPTNST